MLVKNRKIRCVFCDSLVKTTENLTRLASHFEEEHEISFKVDLVLALNFLGDEEVTAFTERLKPRIDKFLETGEICDESLVFFHNVPDMEDKSTETEVDESYEEETTVSDEDTRELEEEYSNSEVEEEYSSHELEEEYNSQDSSIQKKLIVKGEPEEHMIMVEENDVSMDQTEEENYVDPIEEEKETGKNPSKSRPPDNIKDINLVTKFGPNQCILCFTEFSSESQLKSHMDEIHQEDQDVINIEYFTLKDLSFPCDMCPLGFLTENILNGHKKLKHRIEVKNSTIKCNQ